MSERETKELKARIASALEPVVEREAEQAGKHPDFDELVRYHHGDLDEATAERIQRHLVVCSACLEDLLDLDDFVAAGVDRGAPPVEVPRPGPERPERIVRPTVFAMGRRAALALAASVLVAVSCLAVWVVRERTEAGNLRQQVAGLSAPRPDVPIVDLLPDSSVRGEGAGPVPVELPSGHASFTLVLSLPGISEDGVFEAELIDPDGRVTWRGRLEPSAFGTFTLGLSRAALAPGEHTIRLYERGEATEPAAGPGRLVETYSFRAVPSGEGK